MSDNVVPFRRSEASKKQANDNAGTPEKATETMAEAIERNRLNQERLKAERLANTKKVLQSYRIK